jgi:hypothetical protein
VAKVIVGIPIEDMPAEGVVVRIEDDSGWLSQQKAKPANGRHTLARGPSHSAIDFTLTHDVLLMMGDENKRPPREAALLPGETRKRECLSINNSVDRRVVVVGTNRKDSARPMIQRSVVAVQSFVEKDLGGGCGVDRASGLSQQQPAKTKWSRRGGQHAQDLEALLKDWIGPPLRSDGSSIGFEMIALLTKFDSFTLNIVMDLGERRSTGRVGGD